MLKLSVPFGLNDKKILVSAQNSVRNECYFCPSCGDKVILKKGEIKTAHFSHKVGNICNQETIIHKTAKFLIHTTVSDWILNKKSSPIMKRKCACCGFARKQLLPNFIDDVRLEYRLLDGSIADVILISEGNPRAVIEIKVTHAVDDIKANRISLPFIELDGNQIIQNPTVWIPLQDKFKPLICSKCKKAYSWFQQKISDISKVTKISLPTSYYRYAFQSCWKCNKEIIVFSWNDEIPALKPIPKTIQLRYSRTAGHKYWANTCPYCDSIQGDFFLHSEPDSPFFGVDFFFDRFPPDLFPDKYPEKPEVFLLDIMKIAAHIVDDIYCFDWFRNDEYDY
jgi:hypothetical protein